MNATVYGDERGNGPQPISDILKELLAQYEARFPGIRLYAV